MYDTYTVRFTQGAKSKCEDHEESDVECRKDQEGSRDETVLENEDYIYTQSLP